MLTRLQVNGFKNLLDVDVRFGPFTCIAGCNGVGKSNLFDAICFLGSLARVPLLEAALSIRGERGRSGDIRHIFYHHGRDFDPEMEFIADMIIPKNAIDDLGQEAEASCTFLRYSLRLKYRKEDQIDKSVNPVQILTEELAYLPKGENLLFKTSPKWVDSVIIGKKTTKLISTVQKDGRAIIKLHQDQRKGRTQEYLAANLPRTVLSSTNAAESPTALCARREMESWLLLQLEPSALRKPDDFSATSMLSSNGEHLPATLHRLAQKDPDRIYQQVTNSLTELIDDVRGIKIDSDEKRQLYTLYIRDRSGTEHPAHSLSDGTLRFLTLSILGKDPQVQGLICLEEPENGIHPERIPAMLKLLTQMAVDVSDSVDDSNPLRQIIVNTHSPGFVGEVIEDTLIAIENKEIMHNSKLKKGIVLSVMPGTWRFKDSGKITNRMSKKILISYLAPFSQHEIIQQKNGDIDNSVIRVCDRFGEQLDCFKELFAAEPQEKYGKN